LPRELEPVGILVDGDRWQMWPPHQPGQPDAMPHDFFGTAFKFVLDSDGQRQFAVLRVGSKNTSELHILYELRGDELKICWARPYLGPSGIGMPQTDRTPKEFKTTPGSDRVLFQLRRQKPDQPPMDSPLGPSPMGASPNEGPAPAGKSRAATDQLGIQIRVSGAAGMKVRLFEAKEDKTAPARFSFTKAGTYRLRIASVPNRKNKDYYPTLEIQAIHAPQALAFLANSYIPIELFDDCFNGADDGAVVTRYYWLDAAEPGADSDTFTRVKMSPTRDQVPEKAIMLAILRLGGIDLEPQSPEAESADDRVSDRKSEPRP
jgi:hypothetical protein